MVELPSTFILDPSFFFRLTFFVTFAYVSFSFVGCRVRTLYMYIQNAHRAQLAYISFQFNFIYLPPPSCFYSWVARLFACSYQFAKTKYFLPETPVSLPRSKCPQSASSQKCFSSRSQIVFHVSTIDNKSSNLQFVQFFKKKTYRNIAWFSVGDYIIFRVKLCVWENNMHPSG